MHTGIPVLGKQRQQDPWGKLLRQPNWIREPRYNERPCTLWSVIGEDGWHQPLAPTHVCACTHTQTKKKNMSLEKSSKLSTEPKSLLPIKSCQPGTIRLSRRRYQDNMLAVLICEMCGGGRGSKLCSVRWHLRHKVLSTRHSNAKND